VAASLRDLPQRGWRPGLRRLECRDRCGPRHLPRSLRQCRRGRLRHRLPAQPPCLVHHRRARRRRRRSDPTAMTQTRERTTASQTATGGDVLVEVMRRHGITHAFGVISIHNLPLVEAVSRELTFVEVRHEAAAVNAADAFARVTGGVGVALTSTGTGAGNAAGAMLEALTAGSRVLHVTGQVEAEWIGSNRGVIHEVPAQLEMLTAISKGASRVTAATDSARVLEEAVTTILTAPHGPVSVEWPTDLQYLARPGTQVEADTLTVPAAVDPSVDEIDAAARLL